MRPYRLIILCVLTLVFSTEALAFQDEATIPPDLEYEVISDATTPSIKRSVDVRLNKRVTEEVLQTLGLRIKASDSRSYQRTFILYYLPDMEVGAGAWASSHFNPELEVEIFGTSAEEHAALTASQAPDESREIIGKWMDNRPFVTRRIVLYRENGKVFMESTYADGSSGTDEVGESSTSPGMRFDSSLNNEDYFVIDRNGDLEIRDSMGVIATAKKME